MTLIGFLAIIVLITVGVLLRVFLAGNKVKKASTEKKPEPPKKAAKSSGSARTGSGTISGSSPPTQPASSPKTQTKAQPGPEPEKSLAKKVLEEEEADPVAEAEVFLTYGLKDKAVEVLAKHLANNPSDEAAIDLLAKAKQ